MGKKLKQFSKENIQMANTHMKIRLILVFRNTNQTHNENTISYLLRWLESKGQIKGIGKDVEKLEPLYTTTGYVK